MLTALKFKLFTPTGLFKTPFSVKGIETYPLPPYSTIIGLLYTATGKKWNGETFKISIQGDYDLLFRDYIRFRKYNKKDKVLQTLPIEVPILYNLKVVIHIMGEGDILESFKKGLEKPSTYLFLSGGELPVKICGIRYVEIQNQNLDYFEINKNAYLPSSMGEKISYDSGVFYRIPTFYRNKTLREYIWEDVYYLTKGSYISGENILIDEEGDILWL